MARISKPLEVEAKLLASQSQLRAIARVTEIAGYRVRPRDVARLHSVYIDTADLTLARHKVALRLRRHAGRWELTAKRSGRVVGLVHERPERTVPLLTTPRFPFRLDGSAIPDIQALVGNQPLRPILITQIYRRRIDVLRSGAGAPQQTLAELALDRVHLRAPGKRQDAESYCEVEIERLHGTRRDVIRLAEALQQRFGLAASTESKFSRGLALLYARKGTLTSSEAGANK